MLKKILFFSVFFFLFFYSSIFVLIYLSHPIVRIDLSINLKVKKKINHLFQIQNKHKKQKFKKQKKT